MKEQQQALKGPGDSSCLETAQLSTAAGRGRRTRAPQQQRSYKGGKHKRHKTAPAGASKQCTRCGKDSTLGGSALSEMFSVTDVTEGTLQCLMLLKTVSTLSEGDPTALFMDTAFMDTLSSAQEKAWFATIQLGGRETHFKLDTGAEVTAVCPQAYQAVGKPYLHAADKVLLGPSRQPLEVLGQFKCDLSYKGRCSQQQAFVVKGLRNNLLGLPAITAFNLAARVDMTYL